MGQGASVDHVRDCNESDGTRLMATRWHYNPTFSFSCVDAAGCLDPVQLVVDGTSSASSMGVLFLKSLELVGYRPLLRYWRKTLATEAQRIRIWARLDSHVISKTIRHRRNLEGEIARGLHAFKMWAVVFRSGRAQFLPPCTSCGTPTGNFCDKCDAHGRSAFGDNSLCKACDSANKVCIH